MTQVAKFTFSPFSENTYILYDDTKDCVIIDPGCYDARERKQLTDFIESASLKPVKLINTHCHLDHVFGNHFVHEKYGLLPECHEGELVVLEYAKISANQYGVAMETSPKPQHLIQEGDIISFGNSQLKAILVPGHSPASLCFYNEAANFVIAGDALFHESIGRTDLPGGNHSLLLQSIKEKLFTLPDDTRVYSGHGSETSIGHEKVHNPFVGQNARF